MVNHHHHHHHHHQQHHHRHRHRHRHQRQSDNNVTCVLLTFYVFAFLPMPLPLRSSIYGCNAHIIQQLDQHHEYRSNGYPRPHLPPPLSAPVDQLPVHLTARELTPAECMVDLTNELAYRILHYHSILNRNNFAFSPTALMSVLVALYEGSTGRSATELKNVLQLPNNRDIVRVGYRDIHRRLRTYFFGSDNPLKGLSLNKENVTITRDYEAILMFYGYDLGIDMVSSTAAPITTTTSTSTTATATTTSAEKDNPPSITTTEATKEAATDTAVETTTTVEITTTTLLTTLPPTTLATTTTTAEAPTTTTLEPTTTTTVNDSTGTSPESETTPPVATNEMESTTADKPAADETTAESTAETTTVPAVAGDTATNEAAELISSFVAEANSEPLLRIQKARVTRLPSAKLQAPLTAKPPQVSYLPSQRKSKRLTTNRSKRHLFGFKELDSNMFVSLFNSETLLHHLPSVTGYNAPLNSYVPVSNEFEVDTEPNFISTSSAAIKQNYNTDVITHVFYLSNQQIIYTTFKVYNAVLYYKYFDQLHMSVLELELDTPEYNLIILLPDYNTDLVTAAAALRSGPKLRLMRKQLNPKWVQAIIPDFKLHGTMFLTNDIQNLGIYDIFEPNRADFRPMSDEKGTYVKHIEQSINIHIRTHPINQIRRNNGAQAQPIQISVNHPFMFFIIDRDLDVAVMSGRILNPLNVRIQ